VICAGISDEDGKFAAETRGTGKKRVSTQRITSQI